MRYVGKTRRDIQEALEDDETILWLSLNGSSDQYMFRGNFIVVIESYGDIVLKRQKNGHYNVLPEPSEFFGSDQVGEKAKTVLLFYIDMFVIQ